MKFGICKLFTAAAVCAAVLMSGCREGGIIDGASDEMIYVSVLDESAPQSSYFSREFEVGGESSAAAAVSETEQSTPPISASASVSVSSPTAGSSLASAVSASSSRVSIPAASNILSDGSHAAPKPVVSVSQSSAASGRPTAAKPVDSETGDDVPADYIDTTPDTPPDGLIDDLPDTPPDIEPDYGDLPDMSGVLPPDDQHDETSSPHTKPSPDNYTGDVYVAASGKGTKFHYDPKCSNMKGTVSMSLGEALDKGFDACKKCWNVS